MAKLKLKNRRPNAADGKTRELRSKVMMTRVTVRDGEGKFQACVIVGAKWGKKVQSACAYGKNPRTALSKALRATATVVAKRGGAFKGYRKGKK